jgi:hypothetical protein
MKHLVKVFSIICLLSITHQVKSQSLDLGVKAGINYASLSDLNADGRVGFTGGAFAGVRFNTLGLQVEALFSQQGGEFEGIDIETDYLLIPVLAKIHFLRVFNLQFGPQFSYLLNEDHPFESEQLDISRAAGLGLSLGSSLRIDARYNFGFTDAFKGASGKNRFISLALGLSFL